MKHVVSVSLGTSKRDKSSETEFLGEKFLVERLGTDGDKQKYKDMVTKLDGTIDCFGIGGTDAYLYAGSKRYVIRETGALMAGAKKTPWVDGSGLKHTLERETVGWLQDQGIVDFSTKRVLLMSAVDRFGMAEAVAARAKSVVYGDLIFGLGIPIPVRSWGVVKVLASVFLPIISQCPVSWFYPTGDKQEVNTPKYPKFFEEADVIAGDWHIIRRYMPLDLKGKIILTQSSRKHEVELLKERGLKMLITTTPEIGGEAFATNVMEAVLVAYLGKKPEELTAKDYMDTLHKLGWKPGVTVF
ncbi:MAG: quinate 5-dehydrogenase [Chthonomonadales bacterium]